MDAKNRKVLPKAGQKHYCGVIELKKLPSEHCTNEKGASEAHFMREFPVFVSSASQTKKPSFWNLTKDFLLAFKGFKLN